MKKLNSSMITAHRNKKTTTILSILISLFCFAAACLAEDYHVIYYYDQWGSNAKGRLTTVVDSSGFTQFFYDEEGNNIETDRFIDGTKYVFEKTYDAMGRLVTLTYPDGEVVTYTYNNGGMLESVSGNTNYLKSAEYNALGQPIFVEYGNNVYTQYEYYDENTAQKNFRLKRILAKNTSTTLQDFEYLYDSVGNISDIKDYVNTATQHFVYDDLYRLTSAQGTYGTQTFQYNNIGNMTYKSDVGNYVYGGAGRGPHQLSTAGGISYNYDTNGNMISGAGRTMTYDIEDRLVSLDYNSKTNQFVYDYDGIRIKKISPEAATVYLGNAYEVRNGVNTKYIFAGDQRITSRSSDGSITFYHSDHLNGTNITTDINGSRIQLLEYYPYGEVRTNSNSGKDSPYKFTGKELDNESGLYYFGARYLDAKLGLYISPDAAEQFPSPYLYAGGNPVNLVDPDGNWSICANFFGLFGGCIGDSGVSVSAFGLSLGVDFRTGHVTGGIGYGGVGYSWDFAAGQGGWGVSAGMGFDLGNNWSANLGFNYDPSTGRVSAEPGLGYNLVSKESEGVGGEDSSSDPSSLGISNDYELSLAEREVLTSGVPLSHYKRVSGPFGEYRVRGLTNYKKGQGVSYRHKGIDFSASLGTPVKVANNGIVLDVGRMGGYGKAVKVLDPFSGRVEIYAHLNKSYVKVGDMVTIGDIIGAVGSDGFSTGPHLHYEVQINGKAVDPYPSLKGTGN